MRIARLATLVFALLVLAYGSIWASGFENTGLGTTARGMGGAFRAVANDWTAAYYNPAGYARIVDNQLGGALDLIHLRNEITPSYVATDQFGNEYGWGIVNGQLVYNFHKILNKPSAGFIVRLPVMGETVFGLSAYQPFDQNIEWKFWALDGSFMRAYNPSAIGSVLIPGAHYKSDIDVVAFQLTAAREMMEERLSVGIGLQLLRADLDYTDLLFRENPRAYPISSRPADRIPEFAQNVGSGYGFGVRGGLLWKAHDKIDVGVTAYVPFNVTVSGDTRFTYVMPLNDMLRPTIDPFSDDTMFVDGSIKQFDSKFESKLKLPASFAIGVSFQATEKLLVAADAEYTLWSKYEGLDFMYSDFVGVGGVETEWLTRDISRPVEWKDAGKVAVGLKYDLYPELSLLAGGSGDQSPSRESTELTPQMMDLGTKYGISGGALLHINQWDIGVVTSYFSYPDVNLRGLTDPNGDNIFDNFPGDYKAQTYETSLSLGYRF